MKIKELIEILNDCDQDTTVLMASNEEGNYILHCSMVSREEEILPEVTYILWPGVSVL